MQISKIARTHLVYQFIIVTLLFLCISYYELQLDKKFIFFLALVPIFFYQLVTLSCYNELLPVAHWLNLSDALFSASDSRTQVQVNKSPQKRPESQESTDQVEENFNRTDSKNTISACMRNSNSALKPRTYKFRNWQTNSFATVNKTEQQPSGFNRSSAKRSPMLVSSEENRLIDSNLTKTYFFPYRQKRLEKWIDTDGNKRPHKIRGRVSNIDDVEQNNQPTSSTSPRTRKNAEIPAVEVSKLYKHYTFPFCQKGIEQHRKSANINEVSNSTFSVPYWQTVEYSMAAKQMARRRRSVSSSNLISEQLDLVDSNRHREFSQSVEISDSSHALYSDFKRTSPKASNDNFSKIKTGIMNCFLKIKKDKSRINSARKEADSKMRMPKISFQSRDSLQSLTDDDRNPLK